MNVPIRLLHVDDDGDMAELTATYLQRENDAFVVETETDPHAALDRIDDDLDAIVCDYDMPGMDGLEFLQKVRDEHPDLPFVLFTGQGSEEIASEAISSGVTDYLQKGYGSDVYAVLANRIENAVERHRSKVALAESQQRLSLFIEQSPLGVIEWSDEFEIRRMNESAERILGYAESDLHGESWRRIVPETEHEPVEELLSGLLEGEHGYDHVHENVRADGARITCEWHSRVITDDDGDVVTVLSQFQDVTERRANRERLEALVDNVPGVIYRVSAEATWPFELIRGSCEELTGYTETELLEDVRYAEELVHPDDRERVRTTVEAELNDGGVFDMIYRVVEKDGGTRWVWERGQAVGTAGATVEGSGGIVEGMLIDVDNLKRSELELDRTNRVLTTLLENLPFGVLVENESREVLLANERFTRLFNVEAPPDELVGTNCMQAADDAKAQFAEPDAFIEATNDRLSSREPVSGEEFVMADGRILERDYVPYQLADGEANLWIYRDVSDDRERRRLLTGLFEESLDGIGVKEIITDEDGEPVDYVYKRVNERFEELTGLRADDVVGKRATDAVPGIEKTPFIDVFGEVGLGGEPRTFEQYSEPLDRYYEISAFSPRHGRCITIFSDVTERKKHERELTRLNEFLKETERLGDLGAWEIDDEEEVYWTQGTRRLHGVDDEYEPTIADAIEFFHAEDRDRVREAVHQALESGGSYDVEARLITAEGTERWVRTRGEPIGDGSRIRGYIQDVTDRKRYEQRLERQNDRLEEFTGVVSHDLRNPLSVALGRTELAYEEEGNEHLEAVMRSLERMDALIDDLLVLSQQGAVIGERDWVPLASVVNDCWENVDTAGSTLVVDADVEVNADEGRLRQLLENLMRNAVQHGANGRPADGDVLTVRIGELDDGFYVEDDGVGIPEGQHERVFETGVTTTDQGTGFGLSIAKRIAEAHGWHIDASTGTRGGARFELTGVERRQ